MLQQTNFISQYFKTCILMSFPYPWTLCASDNSAPFFTGPVNRILNLNQEPEFKNQTIYQTKEHVDVAAN